MESRVRKWCTALLLGGSWAMLAACGEPFHSMGDGGTPDAAGPSSTGDATTSAGGHGAASGGSGGAGGTSRSSAGGAAGKPNTSGSGGAAGASSMIDGGGPGGVLGAGEPDAGDAATAGSAYRRQLLADRPLVYWRMDIASGASVPDETGGGNALVLKGSGHRLGVEGAIRDGDTAVSFDGTSSYAIATEPRAFDFAENRAFSLECWAKRMTGGASYFQHLFSSIEGSANDRNGYILYLLPEPAAPDSPRSVFEYDRPMADLGTWGPLPAESAWGYYVAVYDGHTVLLYVDGVLASSSAVTGSIAARTGAFAVARGSDSDGFYFKGALDELAIYPRALGADTIARHFSFAK